MASTAILFPGQGSQTESMREHVARVRPDLLEAVIERMGEDPFPRIDDGTHFAQPAIFCASMAGWETLGRPLGDYMAGHSLGELGALVAAGAIEERDGLELVVLRGELMQRSGERAGGESLQSSGDGAGSEERDGHAGGMLAVLGARAAEQAPALAEAHGLAIANDNSPQQVVLSGRRTALPGAAQEVSQLGLRAMELDVTGAFHSPMMAGAVPEFERALAGISFSSPRVPVLSAVTAKPFDDIPLRLAQALTRPVRWRETMLALHSLGVGRFIEVGPGRVLTGLAKRTLRDVELVNA